MLTFKKSNPLQVTDALIKEAQGLERLRRALNESGNNHLKIPQLFDVTNAVLEMTAIEQQRPNPSQMKRLGIGLALLHQIKQPCYGLEENNYIGLNPQVNCLTENWGAFFVEYRLRYQIGLLRKNSLKKHFLETLTRYQQTLIDFLNTYCEHASLVHGDLWSGNVLFDKESVWLIDPASYFGDREVDLAMTEMFGGFTIEFYRAYDTTFPRTSVYHQKKVLYNLYHYLNHYNLFGDSYLAQCHIGFDALKAL